MKTKKQKNMGERYPNMTTVWITKSDKDWLIRIAKKMKKRGAGTIVSSLIELVKFQKSEGELK